MFATLRSRSVARAVAAEVTRRKCLSRQNPPATPKMRLEETLALTPPGRTRPLRHGEGPALSPQGREKHAWWPGIFMLSGVASPHGDLHRRLPFLNTR